MSKKLLSKDDDQMQRNPDSEFQDEGEMQCASVTSPTATALQDLTTELYERILSEIRERKLFRCTWKASADRVAERLRNVCPQWNDVLTTDSFRSGLHQIIDTYSQVEITFNILARRRFNNCVTIEAMNDEVFVLFNPSSQQQAHVEVHARNDLWTVKRSTQLPDVTKPWDMVACSVSNCLYVLHQAPKGIAILRVSTDGQQFQVSHFTTCSTQLVSRLFVAGDGRLIVYQGPAPAKITVYNMDGTVQRQIELEKPISHVNGVLSKANENFVLIKKGKLTEVGGEGNTLYEHTEPSGENLFGPIGHYELSGAVLFGAIDHYDRMVIIDDFGNVRLLDSEFNSPEVELQLDSFQGLNKHFYKVSYNRQRNEFVAFETAAYCDADANQSLTIFNVTEKNVPNDAQNKQN